MSKQNTLQKNETSKLHVNLNHKDSLFRMIFNDKKDLLELYNAINGTAHTHIEDLTLFTLEDAIYISYKNDISFLFDESLSLYEHQSTLNPNMPLRGFIYFARNYEAYIKLRHLDIHSSVLQKIPLPRYIVFYNGTTDTPERRNLYLSDAFSTHPGQKGCLQCEATLLNINYGKNQALMKHCRKLGEYAFFIHSIRSHTAHGKSLENAVSAAVDECIQKHILEDFLVKHRAEVENMVLSSFDQENHDRILKEYYEQKGIEKGKILTEIQLIQRMISKNLPLDTLSQFFEESTLNTSQITEAIQQHPEMDESQIYALLYESLSGEEKDI